MPNENCKMPKMSGFIPLKMFNPGSEDQQNKENKNLGLLQEMLNLFKRLLSSVFKYILHQNPKINHPEDTSR